MSTYRSGHADLPLHYEQVPPWLAQRMSLLGGNIIETIVAQYGKQEVLRRMSDPMWFQALGCVLGMDWHSSGITTSVMGALKKAINPLSKELGLYFCGGKGKHSTQTPAELMAIAEKTGLNGAELVRSSKLSAKVDNTAVQDGFQLYLHCFVLTDEGQWAVIQQGMNGEEGMARRYHWLSEGVTSFVDSPHNFIYGQNQGIILNLTDKQADKARHSILEISKEETERLLPEIRNIIMPSHHDVRTTDVNMKRLGTVLALAQEREVKNFEELLLLEGLGPRTLQSLALVSEVIHGTPTRFNDPARFSFAHGGKDGHPFPVPLKTYDETINTLKDAVQKSKIGITDKQKAIQSLHNLAVNMEKNFTPNNNFNEVIEKERAESWKYGGRTVKGMVKPPVQIKKKKNEGQMSLF